jgi:molecular chaperone GrpE
MAQRMHSVEDEAVAVEAVDPASLIAENRSLHDRLLRALADAENARRRTERIAEEARQYAISSFAREMLLVADNLHRAIEAAQDHPPTSPVDQALLEGVRTTERMLRQSLERVGIHKISAQGVYFDPEVHEAVLEIDTPDHEPGTVARVIDDGYMIHGRLLRPARVAVARRRPGVASDDPKRSHHP